MVRDSPCDRLPAPFAARGVVLARQLPDGLDGLRPAGDEEGAVEVAGSEQTFPVFVWGIARVAVPPQVNVVASAIFLFAILLALSNVLWQYRAVRKERGSPAA